MTTRGDADALTARLGAFIGYPSSGMMISIITAIAIIALTTRFMTRSSLQFRKKEHNGPKVVPMVPYWTPILGHLLSFMINPHGVVRRAREQFKEDGLFSLNLAGSIYNIVYDPSLIEAVHQQPHAVLDFGSMKWTLAMSVFGVAPDMREVHSAALQDLENYLTKMSLHNGPTETLLEVTLRALEDNIPSLISFSASQVDQYAWERQNVVLASDTAENIQTVEVSLFNLIRKFVGYQLIPVLMGSSFLENFPTFLDEIWELDSGFKWLAFGLPRWVPLRASTKAHLARARLNRSLATFHRMLDQSAAGVHNDLDWIDVTDVSELMKQRNKTWREAEISPERRAPIDLQVLWAMSVTVGYLVYWMIVRVISSPGLVDRIRQETKSSVRASQPEPIFKFPEPPRLKVTGESLFTACPLLKACYLETLRLDSSPWSVARVRADSVLTREQADSGGNLGSFSLERGTSILVANGLHYSDPRSFHDPELFLPERFLEPTNVRLRGEQTADSGFRHLHGEQSSMFSGWLMVEKECLALVASIVALWDFEPASAAEWSIPGHYDSAVVSIPDTDTKARLSRRKLS